jgi:hypothetical protein
MWAFVQKPERPDAAEAEVAEMLTHPGSVLDGPRRVENGLFVYEVVDHNGMEVCCSLRGAESAPCTLFALRCSTGL